ncbi:MAG TPA: histidine kinase [Solirubrobacteraceae bacterium]|nr:histidine kinase [Solirubrobacteraceae bacterium]
MIAAVFVVAGEIEIATSWGGEDKLAVAILSGIAFGSLAWRRTRPVVAGAVMYGAWNLCNFAFVEIEPLDLPLICAIVMSYAMGAYSRGREVWLSLIVVAVGMGVISATFADVVGDYVFPPAFALIAWLAGRGLHTRTRLTEELHEAAVQAQEAHEHEAARAAADERRRIAREMHDVVAHSVSVMVVQAGGARCILERDPARAVAAAATIEETGRAALAEMRRLLGVLHHGDERAPQPTLRELDRLVERTRAAGLPLELTVEGEPRPLPPGKDLAAYRVVQEALTNAIKHAGAAPTAVAVRWEPGHLELEIVDRGGPSVNGTGGGHGLVGMEERMRLYGGALRAGRRAGGGFEVVARLPL